jgi:hypothetical protein
MKELEELKHEKYVSLSKEYFLKKNYKGKPNRNSGAKNKITEMKKFIRGAQ